MSSYDAQNLPLAAPTQIGQVRREILISWSDTLTKALLHGQGKSNQLPKWICRNSKTAYWILVILCSCFIQV